jgi:hypothetical protein
MLTEGEHVARFTADCFDAQKIAFSIRLEEGANSPMVYEPVLLTPSTATLELQSDPQGLEVRVDGAYRGKTPLKMDDVCSGKRRVEARDEGRRVAWFQDVRLVKGASVSLQAKPRPSLGLVGVRREQGLELHDARTSELAEALAALEAYNLLVPAEFEGPQAGESAASFLSRVQIQDKADLYLLGIDNGIQTRYLLSAASGGQDVFQNKDALAAALLASTPLTTPTMGFEVLDVRYAKNPLVYYVAPDGPAAKAGLKAGTVVTALGNRPLASAADFYSLLRQAAPGIDMALRLAGRDEPMSVRVLPSPLTLPLESQGQGLQKTIGDLRFLSRAAEAPDARATALLNLGAMLYLMGQNAEALSVLSGAEFEPSRRGIGQGALLYVKALAWLKDGKTAQAREALSIAASQESATLGHDFGMPLAPLARRLQEQSP